ncbi:hypothetical protein HID58_093961, partial [Brassica napus]
MNRCVLSGDGAGRVSYPFLRVAFSTIASFSIWFRKVKQKTIRFPMFKNGESSLLNNLLYLAASPVGKTIVTEGGDATLSDIFRDNKLIFSVLGGICAERSLLGVTRCETMLEERVRSYANHQNQDSLQLVLLYF